MDKRIKINPPQVATRYELPARDDLVDVKIARHTRNRLMIIKQTWGFKNLDHLIVPALDAWEDKNQKERAAKR